LVVTGSAQPWAVKKGAVWWIRCRVRDGVNQVVVQGVQGPEWL